MAFQSGRKSPEEDYGMIVDTDVNNEHVLHDAYDVNIDHTDKNEESEIKKFKTDHPEQLEVKLQSQEQNTVIEKKEHDRSNGSFEDELNDDLEEKSDIMLQKKADKEIDAFDDEEDSNVSKPISRSEEKEKLLEMTKLVSSNETFQYENSDVEDFSFGGDSEEGNRSISSRKIRMSFRRNNSSSMSKKAKLVYKSDSYSKMDPYFGLNDDDDDDDDVSNKKKKQNHEGKIMKAVGPCVWNNRYAVCAIMAISFLIIIALLVALVYLYRMNKNLSEKVILWEEMGKNISSSQMERNSSGPSLFPTSINNSITNETIDDELSGSFSNSTPPSSAPSSFNLTTIDDSTRLYNSSQAGNSTNGYNSSAPTR